MTKKYLRIFIFALFVLLFTQHTQKVGEQNLINSKTENSGLLQDNLMDNGLNLNRSFFTSGALSTYDPTGSLTGLTDPLGNSVGTDQFGSTGGGNGGGSTTPAAPVVNPNQPYIDLINSAIGRLPGELQTAQTRVQQGYDTNLNQLNSAEAQAKQGYNQGTTQNQQQFVTNKNQINDQASTGLRSLLRVLGQAGAGGSSAALYAAPNAVGTIASQQRAGAGQTFGQNQQGLDTNWNNYETGVSNSKKQLSDWLTGQLNNAQTTSEQSRQSLLQQLAGLQPTVAAAQPYIDQINASAAKVDQLGNFNPQYTGQSPVYTAPDVSSYTVGQVGAPQVQGGPTGNGVTPALSFLLGQRKDQNAFAF